MQSTKYKAQSSKHKVSNILTTDHYPIRSRIYLHPSALAKRVSILLCLAIVAFYFYGLGLLPLVGPDEPRYAQVAREMLLRGDLITPTLGGHTWFEKPALLYWMMIAAFKAFGVNEWSARLGSALSGLLTIAAVWCVGRQIERTSSTEGTSSLGFWSALAAATSFGIIVFSRGASFDIIITMTTTWALSFFLLQELASVPRSKTIFLIGFYALVGMSLVAKGLVGIVIPFGVITLYYLLRRELPARRVWLSLIWGVPVALAVSSIWYGPVIYRHGWQFIDQFFIQHHFARYISNKYHHAQPVYFYLLILVPLTLPWSAFLFEGIGTIRHWNLKDLDGLSKARVFSLAWLLLPILFFSFSGSKLPGYILPVLPAASLIVGERLARLSAISTSRNWPLRATGVVCLILGASVLVYTSRSTVLSLRCGLLIALPLFVAGVFAVVWTRFRSTSVVLIAWATLATGVILLNCGAQSLAQRESVRDLLQLADARGYARAPVFARRGGDRTAEFYASGRVAYGADGEVVTLDEVGQMLEEARRRGESILVLLPVEALSDVNQRHLPELDVIGSNGRVALVAVKVMSSKLAKETRVR
jgi:4-amino-4-deoxy-L-arabinose transferase-like glycosyltransferase